MAFDFRTHIRDQKTGQVIKDNTYRRVQDERGTRYERPIDSGIWYDETGKLLEQPASKQSATSKKMNEQV